MTGAPRSLTFAALWGLSGVLLLLGQALYRLTPKALSTLQGELSGFQWGSLALFCLVMAYSEGYKGFYKAFSPRVAARAFIAHERSLWATFLAPAFCMALFDATRKRLIVSWILVSAIIALVLSVQLLPDPWRGIVDAGVVVGLAIGWVSTLFHFIAYWRGNRVRDPELGAG